jgi:hypothetical protein
MVTSVRECASRTSSAQGFYAAQPNEIFTDLENSLHVGECGRTGTVPGQLRYWSCYQSFGRFIYAAESNCPKWETKFLGVL